MTRDERIAEAIAECTECNRQGFHKRPDCDGCTSAVDEEIAKEIATAERAVIAAAEDWFRRYRTVSHDGLTKAVTELLRLRAARDAHGVGLDEPEENAQ